MLFRQQRVSLFGQPFKLFILLRDAVGVSIFIRSAGTGRSLFDQLADVVAHNGDALFEFRKRNRTAVAHKVVLGDARMTLRGRPKAQKYRISAYGTMPPAPGNFETN